MMSISARLESLRIQQKTTSAVYKPVFYKLNKQDALESFRKLLETPGITVVDHILEQITEFVKLQSPHKRFSTDELKSEAKKHIGTTELNEYGVWVHYPWSNRLVHILDESEFIEVRTSRNQYKITREERDILATKKIGIIGLSVGQSVSVTLAMERICGELRLADFDLLELTNLNRIRTGVHNLGLAKVYSVAREIAEIDPYIKVLCYPEGLSEANLDDFFTNGGKLDLLVEESDGFDIKILSRYKARELRVPVIMEASDKCMVDVERFDLEPERSILHGIVKHLDIDTLKSLKTNEEKIPYMLDILGLSSTSPRLRASMLEMQQTISTWPQLGSAVTMGGGITADVSRRMLLNHFTDSGRYYVDIDELIGNKKERIEKAEKSVPVKDARKGLSYDVMLKAANAFKGTSVSDIKNADLEKIVKAALMAPSYGNKQPWKWLFLEKHLFLFKDSDISFNDTQEQNAFVSIGAAIENLNLSAEESGYKVHQTLQPLAEEKDLIAVFGFEKSQAIKQENDLAAYIPARKTNRRPGNGKPLEASIFRELTSLVKSTENVSVSFLKDKEKIAQVAQIAGAIERIRLLHPLAHEAYFTEEIRWGAAGTVITEGIDVKILEFPPAIETAFEVISDPKVAALLNEWQKGSAFEKLTEQIISSSSAIGLISIPSDSVPGLLDAGRLAERIWLSATKNNLAIQPICLPLSFLKLLGNTTKNKNLSDGTFSELKALKTQLSLIFSELKEREAVFLFRLFEAGEPLFQSLRKPLNEVYFKS